MIEKRIKRIPPIGSWQKLLRRYLEANIEPAREDYLNFLTEVGNPFISYDDQQTLLCATLPKMLKIKGIYFLTVKNNRLTLEKSSQSTKICQNFIEGERVRTFHFNKKTGYIKIDSNLYLNQFVLINTAETTRLLIVVHYQILSKETRQFIRLITNFLTLQLMRLSQQNLLTQEKQRLVALTHHLSEGMFVLDSELKVTLWNRQLSQITQFNSQEALGKAYELVLIAPNNSHWLIDLIELYKKDRTKQMFDIELELMSKKRKMIWVNVSGSFFTANEGGLNQIVCLVRDISHLKQLEQRKSEFISIATHELRTPITAIKGYLSLLNRPNQPLEKQKHFLNRLSEANDRLVRLSESLLKVTQIEQERVTLQIEEWDLMPLLDKLIGDFTHRAASKNIALKWDKKPDSLMVKADKEKCEQIFGNLIDNALKYTKSGFVKLRADSKKDQKFQIIEVEDSGIGIARKYQKEIFEKFRRTHSLNQSTESGAGLGLYIVKSFIEIQSGSITVQSRAGKGTIFCVKLPKANNVSIKKGEG